MSLTAKPAKLTAGMDLSVSDIQRAETRTIKMIQARSFRKEIAVLKSGSCNQISGAVERRSLVIDSSGVLRAGGRLQRATIINDQMKHPIILPKQGVMVKRIVEWYHKKIEHLGRTSTINELRQNGYWIINCNALVRSVVFQCVVCRMIRAQSSGQKMSDLPASRMTDEAPFTYCGVDLFGPFIIKDGRKQLKRYGIIFTCFRCRGIHLETTATQNTDSFILALRRFIGRRGPVRIIHSDNGGNFTGAEAELKKAFQEMDHGKIKDYLQQSSCDWIMWKQNPPNLNTWAVFGNVKYAQLRPFSCLCLRDMLAD